MAFAKCCKRIYLELKHTLLSGRWSIWSNSITIFFFLQIWTLQSQWRAMPNFSSSEEVNFIIFAIFSNGGHLIFSTPLNFIILKHCSQVIPSVKFEKHESSRCLNCWRMKHDAPWRVQARCFGMTIAHYDPSGQMRLKYIFIFNKHTYVYFSISYSLISYEKCFQPLKLPC